MEYIAGKSKENSIGVIGLSTAVFESISTLCIDDLNYVRIIPNLISRKGVNCKVVDKKINITIDIIIRTGNNVQVVCDKVQQAILSGIKQMTDFTNVVININVKGFYI